MTLKFRYVIYLPPVPPNYTCFSRSANPLTMTERLTSLASDFSHNALGIGHAWRHFLPLRTDVARDESDQLNNTPLFLMPFAGIKGWFGMERQLLTWFVRSGWSGGNRKHSQKNQRCHRYLKKQSPLVLDSRQNTTVLQVAPIDRGKYD